MAQQSGHKRDNMVVLSDDEEASTDSNSAQPSKKRRKLNDGQAHGLTKSTKKQSNNLTQRSIFSSFGLKDPNPPKQQKQSKKHDKKAMRFKANTNTNDTQTVQSVCDSDHPLIPFNPKERKNDVLSHTIDGIAVYKCQKRHTKRQWTNAKYIKTGNEIQYIQSNCFYFTEDKYNSIKKNAGLKGNIYEFMKFEDKMDTTDSDQHAVSSISWHCYACHEYNQSHQSVITTSTLKSIVEGVPLNCSTISRVDVWKRHLKQQDGKALTYHSCAVKWLAVRRKDMLSHMMNEEVLKQAKRNSSFAQWFPIFTAVYYGVMHNESILGILDCRNDLLPVITEYYLKCLKANIIDKSKEVNDKLKSKLEIDLKHIVDPKSHDKLNEILSVIDKRGKAYVEWIKSHQLHELAFLRKDFYGAYNNREGIKQIIACIADTLRDESFELWKASPYLSLLGDESTDKGDCQRMILYLMYLKNIDSQIETNTCFLDIIEVSKADAKTLKKTIEDKIITKDTIESDDNANHNTNNRKNENVEEKLQVINKHRLDKEKFIHFGGDGASVMVLLAKLLKEWNAEMLGIHCIIHSVSLSNKDVYTQCGIDTILKSMDLSLKVVLSFINRSPKTQREIEDHYKGLKASLTDLLSLMEKLKKVTNVFDVRWLSRGSSYDKLASQIPVLLSYFYMATKQEEVAARKGNLQKCLVVLQNWAKYHKFCIAADIFNAIQPLKVIFQEDNLYYYRFESCLNRCLEDLESLLPPEEVMKVQEVKENSNQEVKENNNWTISQLSQEYSDSMGSREQKCWKNITFHDDTKKWNDNSITPHLRSAKDQQKNVFLKIDDKIPIRRYSKKTTMKAISFKRRFIESQVKNIQNRLKHVKQFNKYKVFSVEVMNEFIKGNVMPKDCTKKRDILRWLKENEYMKDETQDIIQDCGVNSIDSIDVVEELQTIWYSMIRFLRRQQGSRAKQTTTRLFWTLNNRELYPRMKYLRKHCQKSLLIPFNSACCERGFSKQNWILGNRRLSMSTDLLRNLMFIIMNGEKWENDERLLEVLSKSIKKFVRSNRTLTSNI